MEDASDQEGGPRLGQGLSLVALLDSGPILLLGIEGEVVREQVGVSAGRDEEGGRGSAWGPVGNVVGVVGL